MKVNLKNIKKENAFIVKVFSFFILLYLNKYSYSQIFTRGADVSWLSEMEQSGRKWRDSTGVQKDLLDILDDYCINAIRLRVWVNPIDGWCGKQDVVTKAQRAYSKGYKIMIDFHYSDSWADPGQQTKPTAWSAYSVNQLNQAVYDHTTNVLNALKTVNVVPDWVQVGNETNNGMLWPEGKASTNMANYATFINKGYDAVKTIFPNTKVVVHIANAFDNALFKWNIGGLIANGAKFDVIGMSMYPDSATGWTTYANQAYSNMQDMVSRYNKEIIVSEIGLETSAPSEGRKFVEKVIQNLQSLSGSKGLGVFWWEPEAYEWKNYGKVAWYGNYGNNQYQATDAMNGFKYNCTNYPKPDVAIISPASNTTFCNGNIQITVNASVPSGSVSKVELYDAETLISTDDTYPYSFTLNDKYFGNLELKAKAITDKNMSSESSPINIIINTISPKPAVKDTVVLTTDETPIPLSAQGNSLKWYSTFIGGFPSISAPVPSNKNIGFSYYYVSQTINSCESERAKIVVKVKYPNLLLKKGWNLIGCPVNGLTPVADIVSKISQDIEIIKNMNSFYSIYNKSEINSLLNFEWGNGYLIKVKNECILDWGL